MSNLAARFDRAPGHARDDGAGATLYVKEACCPGDFPPGDGPRHAYRADWTARSADVCQEPKWKSALYMRRSESRITLGIVSVRVERVQDISEADARAEGRAPDPLTASARETFRRVWCEINGKRAPWAFNPFVWVLEFRRLP